MDTQTKVVFISTLAFSLLFINVAKSHQVLQWQPSTAKKLGYLAIIWLLPLVGALMVHFLMDLNCYQQLYLLNQPMMYLLIFSTLPVNSRTI